MDKVDKKKLTPLGFALKNNKTNIAELLIQLGAKEKAEGDKVSCPKNDLKRDSFWSEY